MTQNRIEQTMPPTKWYYFWTKDGQPGILFAMTAFVYPLISLLFLILSFVPSFQDKLTPQKITETVIIGLFTSAALMLWKLANPYARWWMIRSHMWAGEEEDPETRKPIRKNFRVLAWIMFLLAMVLPHISRKLFFNH